MLSSLHFHRSSLLRTIGWAVKFRITSGRSCAGRPKGSMAAASGCVVEEDDEVMIVDCVKPAKRSDGGVLVDTSAAVLVDLAQSDTQMDFADSRKRYRSCYFAQSRRHYKTSCNRTLLKSRSSDEVSTGVAEQAACPPQFAMAQMPTIPRPPDGTCDSITRNFKGFDDHFRSENELNQFKSALVRGVQRHWEPPGVHYQKHVGKCHTKSLEFTLASYNVLCQTTIRSTMYLYPHCPRTFLDWTYRWPNLAHELWMLNSDILCLQEVESDHYETFYKPYLESLGYQGMYKRRTGGRPDGCAIFYKASKFRLVESRPVEYFVRGTLLNRDNVGEFWAAGLIAVLQSADSETSKSPSKHDRLVVATTHLLFNPKRGDIKLAQLAVFLAEVERAAYRPGNAAGQSHHPVIICGDFNTLPHSPLYNLMSRGELRYEGCPQHGVSNPYVNTGSLLSKYLLPREACVTDDCIFLDETNSRDPPLIRAPYGSVLNIETSVEILTSQRLSSIEGISSDAHNPNEHTFGESNVVHMEASTFLESPALHTGLLRNPFKMVSVYNHYKSANGADEVTTQHAKESASVDYIFYSVLRSGKGMGTGDRHNRKFRVKGVEEGNLHLLERYSLVSAHDVYRSCGNLPNQFCSSDHLPLMARFSWCQD